MNPEHWCVFGRSRAAAREQRLLRKIEFGFDEQVTERWMRQVARGRRQHHFSIRSQLDLARPIRMIGDRYASQFAVILTGNNHFVMREDAAVAPPEICFVL